FTPGAIDDHAPLTVHADEQVVILPLQARLSDDVALRILREFRSIQFLFGNFADISDGVSGQTGSRVEALLILHQLHFGVGVGVAVGFDKGDFRGCQILLDHDGNVFGAGGEAPDAGANIVRVEV